MSKSKRFPRVIAPLCVLLAGICLLLCALGSYLVYALAPDKLDVDATIFSLERQTVSSGRVYTFTLRWRYKLDGSTRMSDEIIDDKDPFAYYVGQSGHLTAYRYGQGAYTRAPEAPGLFRVLIIILGSTLTLGGGAWLIRRSVTARREALKRRPQVRSETAGKRA